MEKGKIFVEILFFDQLDKSAEVIKERKKMVDLLLGIGANFKILKTGFSLELETEDSLQKVQKMVTKMRMGIYRIIYKNYHLLTIWVSDQKNLA